MLAQGMTVEVRQSYQPTQQGANSGNALYFSKIGGDKLHGYPKRESYIDNGTAHMQDKITQVIESMWQITAWARQPQEFTASDFANTAAMIMQTDYFLDALRESGISILRISAIRNINFKDDRDQTQFSPSFDFTLISERSIILGGKVLQSTEINLKEATNGY